ncbi:hypothetical protein J6590_088767, partial [Homalodisca vitripennis]
MSGRASGQPVYVVGLMVMEIALVLQVVPVTEIFERLIFFIDQAPKDTEYKLPTALKVGILLKEAEKPLNLES